MDKTTTRITVTIPTILHQSLKHISKKTAIPLSSIVNIILTRGIMEVKENLKIKED